MPRRRMGWDDWRLEDRLAPSNTPPELPRDVNAVNISTGSLPAEFVNLNGVALFSAQTPAAGKELWRSDGTSAGTWLVRDILPGATGSSPFGLVLVNGVLYFAANDGVSGTELWRSDGTSSGTTLVRDISPG